MSVTVQQTTHLVPPNTVLKITYEPETLALSSGCVTSGTWFITGDFEIKTNEHEECYMKRLDYVITVDGNPETSGVISINDSLYPNGIFPFAFNSIVVKANDFKLGMSIKYLVNSNVEITVKRFIAVKV